MAYVAVDEAPGVVSAAATNGAPHPDGLSQFQAITNVRVVYGESIPGGEVSLVPTTGQLWPRGGL